MIEIEKKYLVNKDFVDNFFAENPGAEYITVSDAYVPSKDTHMTLRLRHKAFSDDPTRDVTVITRKTLLDPNDKTSMLETTIPLDGVEYAALSPMLLSTTISKKRYKITFNGHPAELDIYTGRHEGVNVLEIEFKDEDEMNEFFSQNQIEFKDITNDEHFAAGKMAESSWTL